MKLLVKITDMHGNDVCGHVFTSSDVNRDIHLSYIQSYLKSGYNVQIVWQRQS